MAATASLESNLPKGLISMMQACLSYEVQDYKKEQDSPNEKITVSITFDTSKPGRNRGGTQKVRTFQTWPQSEPTDEDKRRRSDNVTTDGTEEEAQPQKQPKLSTPDSSGNVAKERPEYKDFDRMFKQLFPSDLFKGTTFNINRRQGTPKVAPNAQIIADLKQKGELTDNEGKYLATLEMIETLAPTDYRTVDSSDGQYTLSIPSNDSQKQGEPYTLRILNGEDRQIHSKTIRYIKEIMTNVISGLLLADHGYFHLSPKEASLITAGYFKHNGLKNDDPVLVDSLYAFFKNLM